MNKLALLTPLFLLAGGAGAWLLRGHLGFGPEVTPGRAEYDAFVKDFGGEEPPIRAELLDLVCDSSAPLELDDQNQVNVLTRECLDGRALLKIGRLREFVTRRGEGMAYHFVSPEHRAKLSAIAGDRPPTQRVIAVRKALARVADGFAAMREPADWSLQVEGGTPPPMPFLKVLEETPRSFPATQLPALRADPRVPAFARSDAELLIQLDQFFNSPAVRAALPPSRFPKLYHNGRIPPIPTAIAEYQKEIGEAVLAEQRILLPDAAPNRESVQAVNEVYARLERFLSAISTFEQ